jgi:hypothetical protein
VFWHVETFASRAAAEESEERPRVVLEAFDKVWLLPLPTPAGGRKSGMRVTNIGPVPVKSGRAYTAQFMEAVFSPN